MAEKVVPESVVPQNISACLIDDNAQIPELDAFTFLNRVRALGIGSADFLYLLKGCEAPDEAIAKIESNPAMNLQGLVVTLENSGLTPKDYTRMLYTARQLWERTLTMQLDEINEATAYTEEDTADNSEANEYAPTEVETEEAESKSEEAATEAVDDDYSAIAAFMEEQFRTDADNYPQDEYAEAAEYYAKKYGNSEFFGNEDLPENGDIEEITDEYDEEFSSDESGYPEDYADDDYSDDYGEEDLSEDFDDEEDNRPTIDFGNHNREEEAKSNVGKIVAAAVGGVILLALSLVMELFGFTKPAVPEIKIHFAADYAELFDEIYNNYNSDNITSGTALPRSFADFTAFGDLLVFPPSEELGVSSLGSASFSAESGKIKISTLKEGVPTVSGEILPPENTAFIEVFTLSDRLCAVFTGKSETGFAVYDENGKLLYSASQQGELTDISFTADSISIGTVYLPPFDESFKVTQPEKYAPIIKLCENAITLPAENIITGGTSEGCGYAVYGRYNLADGTLTESYAAIGSPVFSAAENFTAVMKTTETYELITLEEAILNEESEIITPIVTQQLQGLIGFDDGKIFACAEISDDGSRDIYLRDKSFAVKSKIANLPESFTALKIEGNLLYICDSNSVIMAINISDPSAPKVAELTPVTGVISGEYALTAAASANAVKLTLYKMADGKAAEAGSYTKNLTLTNGAIPEFTGTNAFYIGGEQRCAAAYSYFDGVSVISEFGILGKAKTSYTLFDDKTGFTQAIEINGTLYLIHGENAIEVK